MTTCYACDNEAEGTCPRCGRAFCPDHGAGICASCANPAGVAPGRWMYRGSVLTLVLGSIAGVWLLVMPPDLTGTKAEGGPEGPIGAPVATTTSAATAAATATARVELYTVKSGDTLAGIAGDFNTTVEAIRQANGLSSDLLQVGQQLRIPR